MLSVIEFCFSWAVDVAGNLEQIYSMLSTRLPAFCIRMNSLTVACAHFTHTSSAWLPALLPSSSPLALPWSLCTLEPPPRMWLPAQLWIPNPFSSFGSQSKQYFLEEASPRFLRPKKTLSPCIPCNLLAASIRPLHSGSVFPGKIKTSSGQGTCSSHILLSPKYTP